MALTGTTLLLLLALLLLFLLTAALLFLIHTYNRFAEQLEDMEEVLNGKSFGKAGKVLEEARDESLTIIEKSEKKAEAILQNTNMFSADVQEEMSKKLKETGQKQMDEYLKALATLRQDLVDIFQKTAKELEVEAQHDVEGFRQAIVQNVVQSQEKLATQLQQEAEKTSAALEKHRAEVQAKMDASVKDIVKQVVQDVVGKSLTSKEQELLIFKSLEEAKQQHVL